MRSNKLGIISVMFCFFCMGLCSTTKEALSEYNGERTWTEVHGERFDG